MLKLFFWLGIGAGLLFLPWFINSFAGKVMAILGLQLTTPASQSQISESFTLSNLSFYQPYLLWLLFFVTFAWGMWKHNSRFIIVSLWWGLIILAAVPQLLHLPGQGAIGLFTVLIGIYILFAIFLGSGFGWMVELLTTVPRKIALFLVCVLVILFGLRERLGTVDELKYSLAGRPDIVAASWIRENTSPESRFLVNSFSAFYDTVVLGSDGGWWLPQLGSRKISVPPINYAFEEGPRPDYQIWVNSLTTDIQSKGIDSDEMVQRLKDYGITHIYIGQQQGRVNYNGPYTFDAQALADSPRYEPVFQLDRVWVFRLRSFP